MSVGDEDALLVSLTGSKSQDIQEDVVTQGSGLSRGDKRRNARLARLRELVPDSNAIVGIDLADKKQAVVVCGHDSQVLARRTVTVRAWELGPVLDWACGVADKCGFAGVTVGCEPTGHRWMVVNQLAAQRDMALVCVNPMLVGRAREAEDYTRDKSDDKDAMLIARLVAQLHCYVPECAERAGRGCASWGLGVSGWSPRPPRVCSSCVICSNACGPVCWRLRPSPLSPATGVRRWRWCWRAVMASRSGWPGWAWRALRPPSSANCRAGVDRGGGEPSSPRSIPRWLTRTG